MKTTEKQIKYLHSILIKKMSSTYKTQSWSTSYDNLVGNLIIALMKTFKLMNTSELNPRYGIYCLNDVESGITSDLINRLTGVDGAKLKFYFDDSRTFIANTVTHKAIEYSLSTRNLSMAIRNF